MRWIGESLDGGEDGGVTKGARRRDASGKGRDEGRRKEGFEEVEGDRKGQGSLHVIGRTGKNPSQCHFH